MAKTSKEKEEVNETLEENTSGELTAEEQAQLDQEAAEAKAKLAAKNATKASKSTEEEKYSTSEVKAMIEQAVRNVLASQKKDSDYDAPEEHSKEQKMVRVSRFNGKFIVGLKNMNQDPYFPDLVMTSVDVWDDKSRRNVPWVTLMFHDGSELFIQLETAIKRANRLPCEVVETKEEDDSYDFGKVEQVKIENFERKGTGNLVSTKVNQKKYSYLVKLPGTGEVVEFSRDVINW